MKEATRQDLPIESQIFSDAWSFLKKWYYIDGTEGQWEQLTKEAQQLYDKSKGNKLSKDIVISVVSYIENAEKQRRDSLK